MKTAKPKPVEPALPESKPELKAKTARVVAIKKFQYGNHICGPGHEIPAMDFDEMKLRVGSGEVRLIKVN